MTKPARPVALIPISSQAVRMPGEISAAPSSWDEALAAAKANILPGLILQAFALAVVLAYYFHPPTHKALEALGQFKIRHGWKYSLVATSLCGGLIPFLYLRLNPLTRAVTPFSHGLFYICFWAYKGVEVDWFYRAQGRMFGTEPDFGTVAAKVAFDQFVYSPLWALPCVTLVFHWKEGGFRFGALRELKVIPFLREYLPKNLFSAMGVWIPAVAIIYSLPGDLQMPLFNMVLCFYALLLVSLMRARPVARITA